VSKVREAKPSDRIKVRPQSKIRLLLFEEASGPVAIRVLTRSILQQKLFGGWFFSLSGFAAKVGKADE
jgi:hypothetical protein